MYDGNNIANMLYTFCIIEKHDNDHPSPYKNGHKFKLNFLGVKSTIKHPLKYAL